MRWMRMAMARGVGRGMAMGVVLAAVTAGAQQNAPQNPPAQKPADPCPMTKDAQGDLVPSGQCIMPSTGTATLPGGSSGGTTPLPPSNLPPSKAFPYPGDSGSGATSPAAGASSPASAAPPSNVPASKAFPYPGEPAGGDVPGAESGTKPAAPEGQGGLQDAGSSGSSNSAGQSSDSSSSSSSSNSAGRDDTDGPLGTDDLPGAKKTRRKLPSVPRQTPSEREAEDLQVAGFYANDGNYKAAYLRAKDAVSIDANDPDAFFVLAESARRLGKLDEAEQSYKTCLKLDPVEKEKKAAEKALKEMAGTE